MKASAIKGFAFLLLLFSTNRCISQGEDKRIVYQYVYNAKNAVNKKIDMKLVNISYQDHYNKMPVTDFHIDSSHTGFDGNYRYEYSYGRRITTIKKFSLKDGKLLQVIQTSYGVNNKLLSDCRTEVKSGDKFENHYLYDRNQRVAKIIQYKNGKLAGYIIYEYPAPSKTEPLKKSYTNS